jgi:hypothetical protein
MPSCGVAEKVGIYECRRRTLSSFFDLAQLVFHREPSTRSVMLACAQYWCDEASDAVQEDISWSPELVPVARESIEWELQRDFAWSANVVAVWAFSAMTHEEGWEPHSNRVDPSLKSTYHYYDSPLMIVQRVDDQLRATWLGHPLRAWLDFPHSQQEERDYRGDEELPAMVPDPPMPALVGRERELFDQVLADPYDRGPRDVLRDVWIQRGDPRGELCVALDAGDQARVAELIARHGRSWLGALQPVIPLSGALFGYGPWIQHAIVYGEADAIIDDPMWGSVEALTFAPGSSRKLVPAMRNVRAIGPVSWHESALIRDGGWQVEDLDLELDRSPAVLASLALPLRVLRLRPIAGLSWAPLAEVAALPDTLERLEIWLPSSSIQTTPAEILQTFEAVIDDVPAHCTLAVGVLDGDQRTGWMLAGDHHGRRLELHHPDARDFRPLAELTGLPLEAPVLALDDWLVRALGLPSVRPVPAPQ